MGNPRYNNGSTAAPARPSASRSPRHEISVIAPRTTNADINTASSATAVPTIRSPTHWVEVTPTDASMVAAPAATVGIDNPHAFASRAYSTYARSRIVSATRKNSQPGAHHTTATVMAMRTAPLRTRVTTRTRRDSGFVARDSRPDGSLRAERNRRRFDAAVSAIALLVSDHGFEQVTAAEIGPQRFGDPDLRVGNLPQQEVADAHLAARPDQQVGIGLAGGVEKIAEPPLVELVGRDAGRQRAPCRVDNLRTTTVVERDVEPHPGVCRRLPNTDIELVLHIGRELVFAADDMKSNIVLEQRAELKTQIPLEKRHQRVDLRSRALPVLDGKRVERQHVDPQARGGLDDVAHRIDAGAVAFDARQMPLRGPPAVAVHDDCDVRGELLEVHLPREHFVRGAGRNPREELL